MTVLHEEMDELRRLKGKRGYLCQSRKGFGFYVPAEVKPEFYVIAEVKEEQIARGLTGHEWKEIEKQIRHTICATVARIEASDMPEEEGYEIR